jgi:peptidoglycan/LPS O-acetylase OafA/YrhL
MVLDIRHWWDSCPRLGAIMASEANSFGVLRLVMATLVLISHSFLYISGTDDADPLLALTGHSLGEHAVQGFFILSGILVAQSFDRSRSIFDFAVGRALRIFPALVVCVLLTALVLGPAVTQMSLPTYFSSGVLPAYIVKTLSLSTGSAPLPGVFTALPLANGVNTSLWTLKYEVLCYAGLAAFGIVGLFKQQWRPVAIILVSAFLIAVFAADPKPVADYRFADHSRYFALYFGTGVLVYLVRDHLVIAGEALLPLAVVFAVALGTRFGELATALLLGYAIVWAASKSFGPVRTICNRLDMSFGVYIFAGPIQQTIIFALPGIGPLDVALIAVSFVVPLALMSWEFIEHPALLLRTRLRQPKKRGIPPQRIAAVLAKPAVRGIPRPFGTFQIANRIA